MKKLIINCDDYGWDAPATQAILELGAAGQVSSTTVMANFASDAELRALAKLASPTLSVGLHLTLNAGQPLSAASQVPSLVDANGQFYSSSQLWQRFLLGQVRSAELKLEIAAQLRRLAAAGLPPSHADSHQHLHQYPLLGPALLGSLRELGVRRVRRLTAAGRLDGRGLVLQAFALSSRRALRGFATPGALVSTFSTEAASAAGFRRGVGAAFGQAQVVEFMSHPGLSERPGSPLMRVPEYTFWRSGEAHELLRELGGELVSYAQFAQ
ncbi:ChbG/HpnK family deacetylase [Hymenobacter sp. HMF4947]|uniref:ChbG/HpnK family deacetylase n=1 Tax=Hymenobacter ginkgonis TaxID=2682976 RepID=A0A7K1TJ07_9BACT|nr:ChbG/HpnK family deacetylase [Hymenobacter ginkgonis]MVN78397.1 ChbG/HpnK family deacetylase [Hymenobacter ginkgonis]